MVFMVFTQEVVMKARELICESIRKIASTEQSTSAFAQKIGTSNQAVHNWIIGRSAPDIDKLADICVAYNVSLSDVFRGEPFPSHDAEDGMEVELVNRFRRLGEHEKMLALEIVSRL